MTLDLWISEPTIELVIVITCYCFPIVILISIAS